MHPTPVGSPVINSGPFGRVGDFNQGGGRRGVLAGYPPTKACLLIKDRRGEPVMVFDLVLGSIFMSDVDMVTELGGLRRGSGISSANDRLFANLYAFMIGIVCNGPPTTCAFDNIVSCAGGGGGGSGGSAGPAAKNNSRAN